MSISSSHADRDGEGAFLSKAAPAARELGLCFTLIGISILVFVACVPYVRVQLAPSPAFVAVYNALSTFNDFTTAVILFGQFGILRSRALLLVASGYLFASLMSVIQVLAFPGVFAGAGLPGAGPQTALWLCIFWHGGFPLALIGYALSDDREVRLFPHAAIATTVAVVIGAVLICWFAATWGAQDARILPPLLDAAGFTSWQRVVNLVDVILAAVAFILLWRRHRQSLLDLWLMVVMSYWLCDIVLSSYLNVTRYDFGFYAGRTYGVLAASFVLAVLVLEHSRLYSRLATAASRLRERAAELLQANEILQSEIACRKRAENALRIAQAELAKVSRITSMGELTSSLAHELNHPIGAMMINAETCLRWLSQENPNVERARTIANMIVKDCARASETVARIQQLFHKRAMLRERIDVNDVIREMIGLLDSEAARFSVCIRTDLMENLSLVWADRAHLKQVLMNLMINGMEAMSHGDGPRELFIKSEQAEGRQIAVSVRDTGVGLPPLPFNQIFNSFITTKPHSVGIGLSISRSIIEDHGGHLRATKNSSRGAHFELTLPI